MKLNIVYGLFFVFSLLLIFITVDQNAYRIHSEKMEKLRLSKLQLLSQKSYKRTRKTYVPERSCVLANQEIKKLLLKEPIDFDPNKSELFGKPTLIKIVKIINHLKERVVLEILAHTDTKGSAKQNLELSQKRADRLKEYFQKRTNLPFIVAIGYGEVFALKDRTFEINLKRIKE
jgi:outer membrane protein OmpA-like peptidoglycan-associated protein